MLKRTIVMTTLLASLAARAAAEGTLTQYCSNADGSLRYEKRQVLPSGAPGGPPQLNVWKVTETWTLDGKEMADVQAAYGAEAVFESEIFFGALTKLRWALKVRLTSKRGQPFFNGGPDELEDYLICRGLPPALPQ